ncbi:MAG: Rab family GTPase [Promethearchaeota archaeon]
MTDNINEINIKLVILGKGGVGKTTLANKFLENPISESYIPTIGYNILRKEYEFKVKNKVIIVNIWDIGGQKSFNPLNPATFTDADAAFLIFDLTKPNETLQNFKHEYIDNLEKYSKNCVTTIVGNKLDLLKDRNMIKDIIKNNFTNEDKVLLVSAKTGENLNESFELLVYNFLKIAQFKIRHGSIKGIGEEYLKLIGKKEKELTRLYIDLSNIDTFLKNKKKKVKQIKKEKVSFDNNERNIENYKFLQEELEKIEIQRNKIKKNFLTDLIEIEELMIFLKKSSIGSVKSSINTLKEQLTDMSKEFQSNLNSIRTLVKEKSFVLKAKAEIPLTSEEEIELIPEQEISKEVSVKSKSTKDIPQNDLYLLYENENPKKKALWRGKETKGFLEWKNNLEKV